MATNRFTGWCGSTCKCEKTERAINYMVSSRRQFVSARTPVQSMRRGGAMVTAANWGRNQNLVQFKSGGKLGTVANVVIVLLLVALMFLIYLMQIAKTGSFSYQLNDVNEQKSELAAEQDNLKVENARLQSLSAVKSSDVAAAMTTPASTDYSE